MIIITAGAIYFEAVIFFPKLCNGNKIDLHLKDNIFHSAGSNFSCTNHTPNFQTRERHKQRQLSSTSRLLNPSWSSQDQTFLHYNGHSPQKRRDCKSQFCIDILLCHLSVIYGSMSGEQCCIEILWSAEITVYFRGTYGSYHLHCSAASNKHLFSLQTHDPNG